MIIEYQDKYLEDVKELLVELEEYIVSIDQDHLDQVGENYKEEMALYDLKEVRENDGKCYLAIEDNHVVGLIMGIVRKYSKEDYLDYKCPKMGVITELIVSKNVRSKGIGTLLMKKMESYFQSIDCTYLSLDVFAYNEKAIQFYKKQNYHTRMLHMIKEIK